MPNYSKFFKLGYYDKPPSQLMTEEESRYYQMGKKIYDEAKRQFIEIFAEQYGQITSENL